MCKERNPILCNYCFESFCFDESNIEMFKKTCDEFFNNNAYLKFLPTYISFSINGKNEKNALYLLSKLNNNDNYPILVSDETLLWVMNTFDKNIFLVSLEYIDENEELEELCNEFNKKN